MTVLRHITLFGCALCIACGDGDAGSQAGEAGLPQHVAAGSGGSSAVSGSAAGAAAGERAVAGRNAPAPRDASTAGSPAPDAAIADAAAHDAAPPDAAMNDAGARDASMPDAGMTDAGGGAELAGWKLVWKDEFDGTKGALLDASRWVYETGGSGFGNNQLEFDTDRAANASLDGNGELTITAIKESYMGHDYTAVRLKTQGKFEHAYGRYEVRMRIPFGQGMWPAFWMMGVDPNNVGWPARGEIDIMENIGREPDTIHGTLHGPGYSGSNGIGAPSKLGSGQRFADDYHVFAIEWEKEAIRWYVDGKLYQTRTPADLPNGSKWVYDHPFFLLLNLAVGGQWPGNPDGSTSFPQTMKVDYVRVYDRAN
jgi:beta-glucanase (GH16 family)